MVGARMSYDQAFDHAVFGHDVARGRDVHLAYVMVVVLLGNVGLAEGEGRRAQEHSGRLVAWGSHFWGNLEG